MRGSRIDPTKPADGTPAAKADLRANLRAAKAEIEDLQRAAVPWRGITGDHTLGICARDDAPAHLHREKNDDPNLLLGP